jgi:ribonuclease HIII
MSNHRTSYVAKITGEQARQLQKLLIPKGWQLDSCPYAHWRARNAGTTVIAYESGKLVVQGKGTAEFVQFILEPEILKEARFGYERELAAVENPAMFTPHAGIDESGKGDYFGPMVIAAVHVDAVTAHALLDLKVADSKTIKSDKKITQLAGKIRTIVKGKFSIVPIGPEAYNRLHAKLGNVNRILAWGHARALENLLEKAPECPRAIADQFAGKQAILQALMGKGRQIKLEQQPRAEADIAVAAASILARAEFVRRLEKLGESVGTTLPKGAGPAVLTTGKELVQTNGRSILERVAKTHFKTSLKILNAGC